MKITTFVQLVTHCLDFVLYFPIRPKDSQVLFQILQVAEIDVEQSESRIDGKTIEQAENEPIELKKNCLCL